LWGGGIIIFVGRGKGEEERKRKREGIAFGSDFYG